MANDLWKLDRSDRSEPEGAENASPSAGEEIPQSVGATLRLRREERGEDLRYVAQILRIRYPYLSAIENGRVDELPGSTYAIGFVRTYADHLGLDGNSLVAQFKAEVEDLDARSDLHFPAPLPEGKIPGGAILLVAVVLAAVFYGIWIYVSSEDAPVAEIVPQISSGDVRTGSSKKSDSTAAMSKPNASAVSVGVAESESGAKSDSGDTAASAASSENETESPTGVMSGPVAGAVSQAVAPKSRPADPDPVREIARAEPPASEEATSSGSATESSSALSKPPKAAAPVVAPVDSVDRNTRSSEAATESRTAARPARKKDAAGQASDDPRIVLHAVADSWVEIRDKDSEKALFARVLFKGDSFPVPNRSGLLLVTGNAGGLRITVDGEPVSPLGPIGSVRRNISLEPERLRAGDT
jgi:cytoskeleton protein RodZ